MGWNVTFHLDLLAGASWKKNQMGHLLSEYSLMGILDLLTLKYNKDWYRAFEFGTGPGLIELKGAVGPFLFFWGFYAQLFCSPRYFWSCWTICSSYFVSSSSVFFVHCIVGLKNQHFYYDKRLCLLTLVSFAVRVDNLNKPCLDLRYNLEFRHERRGKLCPFLEVDHLRNA